MTNTMRTFLSEWIALTSAAMSRSTTYLGHVPTGDEVAQRFRADDLEAIRRGLADFCDLPGCEECGNPTVLRPATMTDEEELAWLDRLAEEEK
jgi:hypothetical protein